MEIMSKDAPRRTLISEGIGTKLLYACRVVPRHHPHHWDINSISLHEGGHICPHSPRSDGDRVQPPGASGGAPGAHFPWRRHSCEHREAAEAQHENTD